MCICVCTSVCLGLCICMFVSVYVFVLCVFVCVHGFVCVCDVCTREASMLWRMKVGGGGREETGGFTIRETGEPKGKELAQGP